MKIIDSHCHFYNFSQLEARRILNKYENLVILSVSEDLESSIKNLTISKLNENVIPAVGIHPWNVEKFNEKSIETIRDIIDKEKIGVLGEIGLDKKFKPETFEKQVDIFKKFLELAKEYDLSVNLHSPEAQREVFDLLIKYDIKKAYFHWYSGDEKLLEEIQDKGYFIGINVATLINKKYEKYIEITNIKNILLESDGPYRYKNIILHPEMLLDLYKRVAEIKNISLDKLYEQITENFLKFIY
ncbi:MAG: TatD family hydrolase [Nanopusillaceae archaeon]